MMRPTPAIAAVLAWIGLNVVVGVTAGVCGALWATHRAGLW